MSQNLTAAPPKEEVVVWILEALAEVRAIPLKDLQTELHEKGTINCQSIEGQAIIAILQVRLNRDLAGPEDLRPDQLTTVDALASLVLVKMEGGS